MRFVTAYFDNGNIINTSINGSVQEIIDYYYLKIFDLSEKEAFTTCVGLAISEP
jgi:hypothetical protein